MKTLAALLSAGLIAAFTLSPAAAATKKKEGAAKRPMSAGMMAARERQKQCGVQWKEAKAAGTTRGMKWPQYWSACNKRLKAAGA